VTEDVTMSARDFRDDDTGYMEWLTEHPAGYVINIRRNHSPADARVHRAYCSTISIRQQGGKRSWTDQYVKVCAEHVTEIEQWAAEHVGAPILGCRICRPDQVVPPPVLDTKSEAAASSSEREDRYEIHGPDGEVVQAWTDDYIRFERQHRPDWQERLRSAIKSCCRQLEPAAGQVLQATFFGEKDDRADVENVVLYGIDSFEVPGANGMRFELAGAAKRAPSGDAYPFSYRYALRPRSDGFDIWQQGRQLAAFGWTDLGAFVGEKLAAQVWLAVVRGQVKVAEPVCERGTAFAVKVEVRPPHRHRRVLGNLVKGIVDGVVAAFQAHTDTTILQEAASRLATSLAADPAEIERHLLDQRRAVLGSVPRLVRLSDDGVVWAPADEFCVAGELLRVEPIDEHWAIRGEVVEVSR
jgi:hypothetical protein